MRLLFPTYAVFLAALLPGCDYVDELVDGPTSPPAEEVSKRTLLVPLAATDLPEEHVIGAADIVMREMTMDDVRNSGWNLSEMMMSAKQIEGRATKHQISADTPFCTSDVLLD